MLRANKFFVLSDSVEVLLAVQPALRELADGEESSDCDSGSGSEAEGNAGFETAFDRLGRLFSLCEEQALCRSSLLHVGHLDALHQDIAIVMHLCVCVVDWLALLCIHFLVE